MEESQSCTGVHLLAISTTSNPRVDEPHVGCQVPPDCRFNAGVDVETFCGAGREGRGSVAPIYIQILEPRLCLITTGLRCEESALGSKSKEREKLSKSKNTSPWKTAEISWQEELRLVNLFHTGVSMTDFAKLFCIDVIKLRCKVSPTGCSIVVFSHSDKSRKQPLHRRRRRRKRPLARLARLAWTSQASQHFYQVWISY